MAKILVVDDNKDIRTMLNDFLQMNGHEVVIAETGEDAKLLLAQDHAEFELLITDIYMPEVDGLEVIRLARKHSPMLKIIAISAGDTKGNLDALNFAGDFGAAEMLPKPFRMPDLLRAVNRSLGHEGS